MPLKLLIKQDKVIRAIRKQQADVLQDGIVRLKMVITLITDVKQHLWLLLQTFGAIRQLPNP